jgi:hypothetical protein
VESVQIGADDAVRSCPCIRPNQKASEAEGATTLKVAVWDLVVMRLADWRAGELSTRRGMIGKSTFALQPALGGYGQ